MRERPILMSAPMVRALLTGDKTQTRRIVKFTSAGRVARGSRNWHVGDPNAIDACPYGVPGDQLWVRETLQRFEREPPTIQYAATLTGLSATVGTGSHPCGAALWVWPERKSLPSIFMPRWACRIVLGIAEVRVQRLQDISEEDARAEGRAPCTRCGDSGWINEGPDGGDQCDAHLCSESDIDWYRWLWESINGAGAWDLNPYVWAVSFKRIEGTA